ncbi:MAG: hypothetical protein QNK37_25730 [Acidobacteriota bacterium]|nr:hypothetical protein [Acidobacteriota bacterium]
MIFLLAFIFCFQDDNIAIHLEDLGIEQFDTFEEQFSYYFDVYNNEVMPGKLLGHRYGDQFPLPEKSLIATKFLIIHKRNLLLLEQDFEKGKLAEYSVARNTVASLRMLADAEVAGGMFDQARVLYQKLLGYYEGMSVLPTVYYEMSKLEGRHGMKDEEIRLLKKATREPGFANVPYPDFINDHLMILERLGSRLLQAEDYEGAAESYKEYFKQAARWGYYISGMKQKTLPEIESMPKAFQLDNPRNIINALEQNRGSRSGAVRANLGREASDNYQQEEKHLLIRNWKKMRAKGS